MLYGYRDICDVTLIDLETGNHEIFMDYLQTASQTSGEQTTYLMGGRGAPKLVGFKSENAMRMEMTSALLSPEILGIMFGTTVTKGVANVPVTEVITATSNTFTLAATPVVGTTTPIIVSSTLDGSIPEVKLSKVSSTPTATEFSLSGLTVTVNSTTYASGAKFIVTYYKASTESNKRVKKQTDKFAKAYKLIGSTLWKDEATQKLYPCRIEIPKIQIEIDGQQLNSAMNGDATTLTFSGECLKASKTSTDLIIYDIDEAEIVV